MALKATVFKAELSISDMDRNYYATHALTLARHPSETDARMMLRLAVFALHASERLAFTRGLCADDEPDMWEIDDTGAVQSWIELGEPSEKRLRKAAGRAGQVWVYVYGANDADAWWQETAGQIRRFEHVYVRRIPVATVQALAALAERSMRLTATIQDGQLWLSAGEANILVEPEWLQRNAE